jgi:hypothetical protein
VAAAEFRIEHRLGIPAPASVVWEVLADVERWPRWNPLYTEAEGRLRIGGRLSLTESAPGREPAALTPRIIDWVPDAQILWRHSERWGLVNRLRYLEIEKLSEEGCIFANGEDWYGRFARYVDRRRRRALYEGMEAMSHALREQAVELWRSRRDAPKSRAS